MNHAAVGVVKLHGLSERLVRVLTQQNGRVLRRTFGEFFKAGMLEIAQRKLWQLQRGDQSVHKACDIALRQSRVRKRLNARVIKVSEVKQQPIVICRGAQARKRGGGARAQFALLHFGHAKFHGRRVQVHAKSIWREMVQAM